MENRRILKGMNAFGAAMLTLGTFLVACGGGSNKKVYFGNLEEGSNVESPFKVQMKAENLIVEPATLGVTEGHGHFHILVDASLASPAEPIGKDAQHIHYGNGQSEAVLDLPVGQHTLILQFAKGDHVPYDPPIYQQIHINVTKQNQVDTAASHADSSGAAKAPTDSGKSALVDTAQAVKTDSAQAVAADKTRSALPDSAKKPMPKK